MKKELLLITYQLFLHCLENPRLKLKDFHDSHTTYKALSATLGLYRRALQRGIITKPELYCNCGVSVELQKNQENQLELLKKCKGDPKVTYAMALCGDWSFLRIYHGASDLVFSDRVVPTYPGVLDPDTISFDEKGQLGMDPYPHAWDEIDWEVYYLMKDSTTSFTEATRRSKREGNGLTRSTIKNHYEKIVKDCKIQMSFFPKGYSNYSYVLLTFNTEYEIGLHRALKKMDRTSYLWKTRDLIILTLFVDHYNRTVKKWKEMEENGLIRNLKVSIPNRYCTPFGEDID
ncbi:MAG: hypothetical protein WBA22_08730 [Candidatus Methanofastidiosia archaeon]